MEIVIELAVGIAVAVATAFLGLAVWRLKRDVERRESRCVARSRPRVLLPAGELRREAHLSQRSAKSQLPQDCHRSGSRPCDSVSPYSAICAFLQSLRTDQ